MPLFINIEINSKHVNDSDLMMYYIVGLFIWVLVAVFDSLTVDTAVINGWKPSMEQSYLQKIKNILSY